jgi:hypothetical protein
MRQTAGGGRWRGSFGCRMKWLKGNGVVDFAHPQIAGALAIILIIL